MTAACRPKPARRWPYLTTDDVVWWPAENRWVGRTSPHLTKRDRKAAAEAREFERKRNAEREP